MIVSPQVIGETRVNAVRKLKMPLPAAQSVARSLLAYCDAPLGAAEVDYAMRIEARWGASWWDALLLASAASAGCTHLLTEDAQTAPVIEGVAILDPFVTAPGQILA
jgi:predicted nucleic acid-binding protein